MNKAIKWVSIVVGGLIVLVILVIIIVPMVVDVQKYKPEIHFYSMGNGKNSISFRGNLILHLLNISRVKSCSLKKQDLLLPALS